MTIEPRPLYEELGLTAEEYGDILRLLGREPSREELAVFSLAWSEHCSYKSSRVHLAVLPTSGPPLVVGPGENAGVLDVGGGLLLAFKVESHNHPSFVEPVSGAATGVGGIIRDILAMGARPIALLDSLRFGPLDSARNRYLMRGVVEGISWYGNCVGIPTVGGEVDFAPCYSTNPLVNVACLGILPREGLILSGRGEPGDPVVLLGSKTGRDGIGGASVLASKEFDEEAEAKRPSVQVGDPFAEKLLIEACLEMREKGLLKGLQDLGAGGISTATAELASKAGLGIELHLDRVPLREPGMAAWEILISESQERMVAVVEEEKLREAEAIATRWGVGFTVLGKLAQKGRYRAFFKGKQVTDLPVRELAEGPTYRRPAREPEGRPIWLAGVPAAPDAPDEILAAAGKHSARDILVRVISHPAVASKRWVYEQYDQYVLHNTLRPAGLEAAILRLEETGRGVALAIDSNSRYAALDPFVGGALAVFEAARKVASTGARPLALTDCLNFGSPERPEVMWAFRRAVEGIAWAARAIGTPVAGGNVSFYNETGERVIYPTPVVAAVGIIQRLRGAAGTSCRPGQVILLVGETRPEFGGSLLQEILFGGLGGSPPAPQAEAEASLLGFLAELGNLEIPRVVVDISAGGMATALARLALTARGAGAGVRATLGPELEPEVWLYSESGARALVAVEASHLDRVEEVASRFSLPIRRIGEVSGRGPVSGLGLEVEFPPTRVLLRPEELSEALEGTIPKLLGSPG